ncbi:MAG: hypothetical protein FWF44_11915, partial [Defluviitaleaceae bacterium]|nr:hypothetical protein [Defluviitaleaceae bacterium]
MYCVLIGHGFEHEIQTIAQIFYANDRFEIVGGIPGNGAAVESVLDRFGGRAVGRLFIDGELKSEKTIDIAYLTAGAHCAPLRDMADGVSSAAGGDTAVSGVNAGDYDNAPEFSGAQCAPLRNVADDNDISVDADATDGGLAEKAAAAGETEPRN